MGLGAVGSYSLSGDAYMLSVGVMSIVMVSVNLVAGLSGSDSVPLSAFSAQPQCPVHLQYCDGVTHRRLCAAHLA